MRSISLVGNIGVGETTFRQHLQELSIEYAKTRAIGAFASAIDTPGGYLEVGCYKHTLMLTSYDTDAVVLMQSVTSDETHFPPRFATTFNREVLEAAAHAGMATETQVHDAVDHLARVGAHRIVAIDSVTGKGFRRA